MKMFLVVEIGKNKVPKIIGLFHNYNNAENAAYGDAKAWRNIIELTVKD